MIAPADGPYLEALIGQLAVAGGTRRVALALRRFNSAYERHTAEDALIDLWIAFEALLLPDRGPLRYRASLRISRLVGSTQNERQAAYDTAFNSYGYRSDVVHGGKVGHDLEEVLEATRLLGRVVLREWVLNRPKGDVHDLDRHMLA